MSMTRGRAKQLICAGVISSSLSAAGADAQEATPRIGDPVAATVRRLDLTLPASIYGRDPVQGPLSALTREKCDQKAIVELGQALDKTGYRRDAANAHLRYAETCDGHPESLQRAANYLLELSDYKKTIAVATAMIAGRPFYDNGYYLRALARDKSGETRGAIDDFITATELFANKDRIASSAYVAMARNYSKLGQHCDAASAIQAWVSLRPDANDSSQSRAMIADYTAKGACEKGTAATEEVFPIGRPGQVVTLPVTINGVRGMFILDTGATFVALRASFAQKAKVQIDADTALQLHTANGVTDGKRGRAASVQLKSLKAADVAIVVQTDANGSYGPNIDGLLGMSFLSRFKLSIDGKAVRVSGRVGQ